MPTGSAGESRSRSPCHRVTRLCWPLSPDGTRHKRGGTGGKRWVPLSHPPARRLIRPEAAPGKPPSMQEVGGRYQALPIPYYSLLAPPPAHPTQPSSFWLSFCAPYFFSSVRASLSCALSEKAITWGKKERWGTAQSTLGGNVKFRMEGGTRVFLTPEDLVLPRISKQSLT